MGFVAEHRLERLLRPKSIAVIGGREARAVLRECDRMGFSGPIWPVHPNLDEIAGRRCFRTIDDLPQPPDAAFVGVNRHATIPVVAALAQRGAGGAVCYANGFREAEAETGDGAKLEAALVGAAGFMPIIGPNCYGLINYLDGALLWPDQHGGERVARGVAIITQSSNIACNLTMQRRALPLAYVLTAGNQAQTSLAEMAAGLLDDPRVTAIGLHIEGFGDLSAFEVFVAKARMARKPVVVMKVGRSMQAQAATVSHTASLAGSDAFTEAFLRRLGLPRLNSIPDLLETLKLLHILGPLPGFDLLSMSCSGGEASLIADMAQGSRLAFPVFRPADAARLRGHLGAHVAIANPLDYQTFVWAKPEAMEAAFAAAVTPGFSLALLILDMPRADRCDPADWMVAIDAVKRVAARTGQLFAVAATMSENFPEPLAQNLASSGIVPFFGLAEALAAAEAAALIGDAWRGLLLSEPILRPGLARDPVRLIDEAESKTRLAAFGIAVPEGRRAASVEGAVTAAAQIGFPVALKGLGIAHKSDAGAVRLGLRNEADVHAAALTMPSNKGFLVERMIPDGIAEFIVGVVREPQGALLLTIGSGGILAELISGKANLVLPASEAEIRGAFRSLRAIKLLEGYRGRPRGDFDAAIAAAAAIARFAMAQADAVEEIEVNPLIVCQEGAFAADALISVIGSP